MNLIPDGTVVHVTNLYGTTQVVLRQNLSDYPNAYRTGIKVSEGWHSPIYRTDGRVSRAEVRA